MISPSRVVVVLSLLSAGAVYAGDSCPYDSSSWQGLRSSQQRELLEEPSVRTLDESCVIRLLERLSDRRDDRREAPQCLDIVTRFVENSSTFSRRLLLAAMRLCEPRLSTEQWGRLCDMWVERNGSIRGATSSFIDAGELRAADSVFLAFHIAQRLSSAELVLWANIRNTLRDYDGLGMVLCELGANEPRLAGMARNRLMHTMRDLETAEIGELLGAYKQCSRALPDIDTAELRDWLATAYARVGLYEEELGILVEFEGRARPIVEPLVRAARRHFALKRYEHAARAARLAYERTRSSDIMGLCASVAYESYDRMGRRDSAAVWLPRTDLSASRSAARAIAFYQSSGELHKADSLLASVNSGLARDTLVVRQLLFSGQADSAAAYASTMSRNPWWDMLSSNAMLWRLRVALFGGDMPRFRRVLDSLDMAPSWEHALEVIGYQYRHERLKKDMAAMETWGRLELALYKGNTTKAASLLQPNTLTASSSQVLSIYLIKELLRAREFSKAAKVAATVDPSTSTPEHTYYSAEVLIGQGELPKARALLERLILEHPASIYSSKARMLLREAQS